MVDNVLDKTPNCALRGLLPARIRRRYSTKREMKKPYPANQPKQELSHDILY